MTEVEKLKRIIEIQKAAINRWVPCPDHRDKTPPEFCPVCVIEKLTKERDEAWATIRQINKTPKIEKDNQDG